MSDVTQILTAIEQGEPERADELLPLVYDELRRLAAAKLAHEKPGQTLEATALVHESFLRMVGGQQAQVWQNRGHFFAAAAEAMRRILIEHARRKASAKAGGDYQRIALADVPQPAAGGEIDLLSLDAALREFEVEHPRQAQVVKLKFFAGCTIEETAELLGISRATAQRHWAYARAWLFGRLKDG
jgi:RNA polymerase sigma factor (TIGR02999 family)